ncbi:Protein of unknown function VcgC/VcgE [Pseudomonas sp. ok272]|uniref:DUF2780 domain-containing protein n=1 Tax=unclassified Pseudomonas TaxID=196821 RepID=UPI0008B5C6E7|nr:MULTISPECIES: DUF2780 domain-containing protein [unclassified Pseudomonas]SEM78940.1 Protein of unknown function VcgC/VcgE [Pseudomonas sp. ok272]SFM69407.1 Protein of unknown function VcgC/VcgE [Pseudomonas sp. ok602]
MKIARGFALASLMTLAASPVFAGFDLSQVAGAVSGMQGGNSANSQAIGLLGDLNKLNVKPEQAIGGASAMLGLAKNQLSGTDYSALTKSVPGVDKLTDSSQLSGLGALLGSSNKLSGLQNSLGSNVKTTGDLDSAFGALGMDSGMVGQFAPVILKYLGEQGVGGPLLKSLGGIWGA